MDELEEKQCIFLTRALMQPSRECSVSPDDPAQSPADARAV